MATVILVIHLMVAATLVGLVLLQRSEGGALGIGGGGSGGGFMSGRGAANMLTRVTAVVAALFFVTSISLTMIAQQSSAPSRGLEGFVLDGPQGQSGSDGSGTSGGSPLEGMQLPSGPQVPQSQ
jgi:preprotein translocase subunit SecG